jgi:hypothetical protein
MVFIVSHFLLVIYAVVRHVPELPRVATQVSTDLSSAVKEIGWWGVAALLMRAYSMGAGTYTGIEAVSNSVQTLREPRVQTAKKAMLYMALSLSFIAGGLTLGYLLNGITPISGKTLNAVLFDRLLTDLWPGQAASVTLAVVLVSEAALLFVPRRFAHLSERLVRNYGVYFMGGMAFLMLYITGGSVRYLVVMYSINVFLTFSLSQFGMCVHWWKDREKETGWLPKLVMNGVGFLLTATILVFTVVIKFPEGGWITLLITGTFILLAFLIKRHYRLVQEKLKRLDDLLTMLPPLTVTAQQEPVLRKSAPTAAIMVSGYNGLGMHVFFSVIRSFPGMFRNFIFLSAGVMDTSRFKGAEEVVNLRKDLEEQMSNYVEFAKGHGYYAEARVEVGTDVIKVIDYLARDVAKDFTNIMFFAGQLVFKEERLSDRLLHNQTAFLAQKRLVFDGLPMIVLPIRAI